MREPRSVPGPLPILLGLLLGLAWHQAPNAAQTLEFPGGDGPGAGKHIVLVSGDEEYRSEEALPQLAKILSQHHGFRCTVLFAIDPETGEINPNVNDNIPGLDVLDDADLLVLFTRFRNLPPEQMEPIVAYLKAGKPVIGMRTATHAFNLAADSPYFAYHWRSDEPGMEGGFGRRVLGETWISHHGAHGSQSTRGIVAPGMSDHPVLTGIEDGDVWGPTDVYGVRLPLPGDSQPLVLGQVLQGMEPDSEPLEGEKNDPMIPVAWTKTYSVPGGEQGRVFTTTMGAAPDLVAEGTRRMLVNASFWLLGLEDAITPDLDVSLVGDYEPSPFKFDGYRRGLTPADYDLAGEE